MRVIALCRWPAKIARASLSLFAVPDFDANGALSLPLRHALCSEACLPTHPDPDPCLETGPLRLFSSRNGGVVPGRLRRAHRARSGLGWPVIARGENALILAPTGTGKTLAAFLWCLDRLMLHPAAGKPERKGCRIVYVSPLKALAVDVERNLRSPLAGIANMARRMGVPSTSHRSASAPATLRSRNAPAFARHPADILITTPESLYLLLTSQAADALRTVDTVIIDEIHALVPTKRGAHLALSLERLEALTKRPIQRIGLSATQRPLEEVARFLGGVEISVDRETKQRSLASETSSLQSQVEVSLEDWRALLVTVRSAPRRHSRQSGWSSDLPDPAASALSAPSPSSMPVRTSS